MPKIVISHFAEEFTHTRDELVARALPIIQANSALFRDAGAALNAEFTEKLIRKRLRATAQQGRTILRASPTLSLGQHAVAKKGRAKRTKSVTSDSPLVAWSATRDPRAGDKLRAARLRVAVESLLRRHRPGKLLSLLGPGQPTATRRANAARAILIVLAVVDPDAGDHIGPLFDLASAPQISNADARPRIVGRAEVCEEFGSAILGLLSDCLDVLDPGQQTKNLPTTANTAEAVDAAELFYARGEAGGYRARGDAVFPGCLLVIRGGSWPFQPVDDTAFDPASEEIGGIALWGVQTQFALGTVAVKTDQGDRFAPSAIGEANRPKTGVGRIDAWIARADTLRDLRSGTASKNGGIPLSLVRRIAAIEEIERVVRETAHQLIQAAPPQQRPTLLALAAVADAKQPSPEELTTAIRELVASAPAWKTPAKALSETTNTSEREIDDVAENNGKQRKPGGWTRKELVDQAKAHTSFSPTVFDRIRESSEVKAAERGGKGQQRRFSNAELRRFIAAVEAGRFRYKVEIAAAWRALLSE